MNTRFRDIGALRLDWCRYGLSRLDFRGPRKPLDKGYVACLGGSDTLARFIRHPYADLLEEELGVTCLNLGLAKTGPDAFLGDGALRAILHDAWAVVVELPSAANLSNRFYKVHPRRNDRFIAPTEALLTLFPDVDFTDVAFTGHLLAKLERIDPVRFETVAQVLRQTWLRRMTELLGSLSGPVQLLWFDRGEGAAEIVTEGMRAELAALADGLIRIPVQKGEISGMSFGPLDRPIAEQEVGVSGHRAAASALADALAAV